MTNELKMWLAGCVTLVALCGIGAWYGIATTDIEADKTVTQTELEADRSLEERKLQEKTDKEQTEERSQFWQKLIPWGKDESEKSD
jgi:hypothetical protein